MDYLEIEVFLALVRTQNLSHAALLLNLSQSTVSKRLFALEQELDTSLFERGKGYKIIQLTPTGEAFVDVAERWMALYQESKLLLSSGPQLTLSIGIIDSVINSTFPPLHHALHRHQPKIIMKMITTHSIEAYDEIEHRKVDVAFSLLEKSHPNVVVEKCYTEPMVVLRVAGSAPPREGFLHPQDLDPNNELFVSWNPGYQIWHDKWWSATTPGRFNLDSSQLILLFLQDKEQWSIVPLSVAKRALLKAPLSICQLSESPPLRTVYKLTHKKPKVSAVKSLEIFDEYLRLCIKDEFSEAFGGLNSCST